MMGSVPVSLLAVLLFCFMLSTTANATDTFPTTVWEMATTRAMRPVRCDPSKFDTVKVTPESTQVAVSWNRSHYVAECAYNVGITWSQKDGVLRQDEVQEQEGQYIVAGLKPYSPVHITLTLRYTDQKGVNHTGEANVVVAKTAVGKPSAPRNFRVANYGEEEIAMEWESPAVLNGPLDGYEYRICSVATCDTEPSQSCSQPSYEMQRSYTLSPVKLQQYYWVWLAGYNILANGTVSNEKVVGNYSALCFRALQPAPPPRSMEIKVVSDSSLAKTQVAVEVPVDFFSEVNGNVTYIEWLVAEESQIDNCNPPATWKEAHSHDPVQCYSVISEEQIWNTTGFPKGCETKSDVIRCVIGNDEDCNGTICNGKVKEGVTYGIKLRAHNGAGYFDSEPTFFRDGRPARDLPPSAPRNFTVLRKTPEWATMVWKEPELPNGILEGYIYVVCNVDACGSVPSRKCSDDRQTSERTFTIAATPREYYWVWLAAYRSDKRTKEMIIGEYTKLCFRTTPPRLSAPKNLMLTSASPQEVAMKWESPIDPSGTLAGYVYVVCRVESCSKEPPTTCSDQRVTGDRTLKITAHPNNYYWVWMAAYNHDSETGKKVLGPYAQLCFRTPPGMP